MRRVLAFLSVATALAVVVAGCGGGGEEPLTKPEYETQVGTIAVGLTEAIQAVGGATTVKGTVAALEKCQAVFEQAAADMEAMTPPEDIAEDHEKLTTGVREFAEQLNPIINRVAHGNRLAVAGIQAMPSMMTIIRASADIGHKGYDLGGPR